MNYKILRGNNLESIKNISDHSIDSVVTDPPYGINFMGKKWDYDVPGVEIWKECLRVLKPGGYLLSFAGTRTQHRMAVNIEDAGFEIRDMIMYVYGSGFPKSHNIEKALNKIGECGIMVVEEVDTNEIQKTTQKSEHDMRHLSKTDISQTESNKKTEGEILQHSLPKHSISFKNEQLSSNVWEGQSSLERWNYLQASEGQLQRCKVCEMSQRVFIDGEERWLCNGTPISNGKALTKVFDKDGSCSSYRPQSSEQQDRKLDVIPKQYRTQEIRRANETYKGFGSALKPACEPITVARKPIQHTLANNALTYGTGGINIDGCRVEAKQGEYDIRHYQKEDCFQNLKPKESKFQVKPQPIGRFPANFIHDGSEEVVSLFPNSKSQAGKKTLSTSNIYGGNALLNSKTMGTDEISGYNDSGSAARYFYCAKCSKKDRNEGLDEFEDKFRAGLTGANRDTNEKLDDVSERFRTKPTKNSHPTVKPTQLMQYLVRLVTPVDGTVLDPFMGSGSTGKGCAYENFDFIGMEMDDEYCDIAEARIKYAQESGE